MAETFTAFTSGETGWGRDGGGLVAQWRRAGRSLTSCLCLKVLPVASLDVFVQPHLGQFTRSVMT